MAEISQEIPQERESCWPEILKRVPARQLGVCRCVSQKWNSLITSSAFVSSVTRYISQTQLQSSKLFVIRSLNSGKTFKKGKEFYQICSDSPQTKRKETLRTLIKKTIICPFKTAKGFQFRVVGCVNGVFFLSDDHVWNTYNFILWNPIVKCYIQLPKPRVCVDTIGPYIYASGFGYDCVNDDFKVVRIAYPRRGDGLDKTPPRAELYSVKEGKWRWVSAENVEYCITDMAWTQCFVRERVHWVAYERWGKERRWSHKSTLLLLFDVVKEKFQMMKLPVELRGTCPLSLLVSECQGVLCVFHHEMTGGMVVGDLTEFKLWVKKEYNVGASWSKMASVDLSRGSVDQVLHWRNNGKLLALNRRTELVSYESERKRVAVLAEGFYLDVWSFVESLALLNEDCKNRRCIVREEDENSSDGEEATSEDINSVGKAKMASYLNQLRKYRQQF